VAGGFGALGNPASFHNPLARKLRKMAYDATKAFFASLIALFKQYRNLDMKEEVLFDRMMFRRAGQMPTAEAWHRDVMEKDQVGETDEIFGGWINLDLTSQFFSCIPGSHLGISLYNLEAGFATVEKMGGTPQEVKAAKDALTQVKMKINVPPGHIVIFPQYIMHEVVSASQSYNMLRLFTGFRLTTLDKSIYVVNPNKKSKKRAAPTSEEMVDTLNEIMDKQAVPQLPGGMIPPVYSANHLMCFQNKPFHMIPQNSATKMTLIEWSMQTFKDAVTEEKIIGTGDEAHTYRLVPRHMKSLAEYGLPLYPPYGQEERKMYFPHKLQ